MMRLRGHFDRRRLSFLLGNLAACAFLLFAIVLPLNAGFAERDATIAGELTRLARLRAVVAQAARVRAIMADTSAQLHGGELLTGGHENVISADLQTRLKAMTESAGAQARAAAALPLKVSDDIRYIGARIELSGSIQSIRQAVHAIESARPYLFITAATIKGAPTFGGQPPVAEPALQAQLDVFGAIQIDGQHP